METETGPYTTPHPLLSPTAESEQKQWQPVKRFWVKIVMFAAMLLLSQLALSSVLMRRLDVYRDLEAIKSADVVLFGDSTNSFAWKADGDKRSIKDFLAELLSKYKVDAVAQAGYHMPVFAAYSNIMASLTQRPKYIVIPINLRSFSPCWLDNPARSFPELNPTLQWGPWMYTALIEPLKTLNGAGDSKLKKTQAEYLDSPVFDRDIRVGAVRDFKNIEVGVGTDKLDDAGKKTFIAYINCLHFDKNHPQLRWLRETILSARKAGVAPIVYITPSNYELASDWYGPEFQARTAESIAIIQAVLAEFKLSAIDMSFDLTRENFFDPIPSEHMKEAGRRHVAMRIAESINGK